MLKNPVPINLQRQSTPAVGITQAVYPVAQDLKPALLVELLSRGLVKDVLVFTRTKHRANRLADHLVKAGINAARIHGNRSQAQRTEALAGFKAGKYRVLVATDIAARGIDVEALGHVVNFDVPAVPEDYIHRIGRTGRAELTGDAFTFVAPDEETDLPRHRARGEVDAAAGHPAGLRLQSRAAGKLEIPLAQRLAQHRAQRHGERQAGGRGKAESGKGPAAPRPGRRPAVPSGHQRRRGPF